MKTTKQTISIIRSSVSDLIKDGKARTDIDEFLSIIINECVNLKNNITKGKEKLSAASSLVPTFPT